MDVYCVGICDYDINLCRYVVLDFPPSPEDGSGGLPPAGA